MKKYTALFLDIDNTLLDFTKAEEVAVGTVLKNHGLPHNEAAIAKYSAINQTYWERFEKGEIEKKEIYEGRFRTFAEFFNQKADTAAISEDYKNELSVQYFKIDGAIDILEYLTAKGYRLYATTNGLASTQYRRIKNSGIEKYFDDIFVSESAGHQKPEKEYFDYVIENIPEKDRSKMLVVGDSLSSDILGGINSNIDTCWFNPNHKKTEYKITYEIEKLSELESIL